jgi:hypothetical protein
MVNSPHRLTRRLHALVHHRAHAFQELVTERMIPLAIPAQGCPVKEDGGGCLGGTRREGPGMRWKHPRPSQERIVRPAGRLQGNVSAFDQVKPIREVALTENHVSFIELNSHRGRRQQRQLPSIHPSEKGMQGYTSRQTPNRCLHQPLLFHSRLGGGEEIQWHQNIPGDRQLWCGVSRRRLSFHSASMASSANSAHPHLSNAVRFLLVAALSFEPSRMIAAARVWRNSSIFLGTVTSSPRLR